jgi:hypothetical protein
MRRGQSGIAGDRHLTDSALVSGLGTWQFTEVRLSNLTLQTRQAGKPDRRSGRRLLESPPARADPTPDQYESELTVSFWAVVEMASQVA